MKTNVTPADALIGAFSSPEDVILIDQAMETARRLRATDAQRQFDLCDDESRTGNLSEMRPTREDGEIRLAEER